MACPSPPIQNSPPRPHPLADIFPDSPPSTPHSQTLLSSAPAPAPAAIHDDVASDIPRLRATHSTAGYRNGISAAKTQWLQPGFDEGYSLGAVLGLRVGYMLGVLEGLYAAFASSERKERKDEGEGKDEAGREEEGNEEVKRLKKLLAEAKRELALENVFGKEWWGEDGMWKFAVEPGGGDGGEKRNLHNDHDGDDDGEEVTFIEVADQHPLLECWSRTIRAHMQRMDVQEKRFEGEEWESGRISTNK